MAFYDYECTACGHSQEEQHGMTEDPKIACAKCGQAMRRVITGGSGFIMKGGTVRATERQRHGKKKHFSTPTPSESATDKASKRAEARANDFDPSNPYKGF